MENQSSDSCFCLEEIASSAQIIRTAREQLPQLRRVYDQSLRQNGKSRTEALGNLQKAVKQLWNEFPVLIQLLAEYDSTSLVETAKRLYTALKQYDYLQSKDYSSLCQALACFEQQLPGQDQGINKAALGRLMNRVKMGYYPTDPDHVTLLRKAVVFPELPVNLIDPCCGEGLALKQFADGSNATTYGIELDEIRGAEAQKRLNKVGFGSYFYSRISSGVFHCLFLNPPYLSAPSQFGKRRLEKSFLTDSIRLLTNGGLLIYIIPYYRATPDICRVLCEHFTHLRVYRFMGKEFERFRQIVFLGVKTQRHRAQKMAQSLSEYMLTPEKIQPITQLPESSYTLPATPLSVTMFRGAVFNVAELAAQLKKSPSINHLFDDKTLDQRTRQPLLPLNLSQIGLVGASGMMNGLIQCDTPHIIKGRIAKEKKTKAQYNQDAECTMIQEITSNKLIFNILTPDGFHSIG